MNSIGERIKYLREEIINKTQKVFGSQIGLKPNSVSDIERNKHNPTDQTIKVICKEFNVNEEWLRNGTGEMSNEETTFSLDDYAKNNNLTEMEKKLIVGFMGLEPEIRESIYSIFENAFSKTNEQSNIYDEAPDTPEELERLCPPIDINRFNSRID